MLSLLFPSEKLMSEKHKEVIDENFQDHVSFCGIEPLHRETAQGKVLFQCLKLIKKTSSNITSKSSLPTAHGSQIDIKEETYCQFCEYPI